MYSTGGIADRFVPLWSRVEGRLGQPLPAALRFWDGSEIGPGEEGSCPDIIVLRNKRALSYAASRPDQLGIARAFVSGDLILEGSIERVMAAGARLYGFDFTIHDKLEAVKLAAQIGAIKIPPPKPPESEAKPKGRLHSLRRDSDSIQHHYDVSNEFYRQVLGPTMVYSCAYFNSPDDSLEEAQTRKLDVVCQKLRLESGERLPPPDQAGSPGQGVYFAADKEVVTFAELGRRLGRAVHRPVRVIPLPSPLTWAAAAASEAWARLRGTTPELSLDKAREATAGSWACSGAKARDGLRIKLRTSMDERLAQTARWYQDQGWFDR